MLLLDHYLYQRQVKHKEEDQNTFKIFAKITIDVFMEIYSFSYIHSLCLFEDTRVLNIQCQLQL